MNPLDSLFEAVEKHKALNEGLEKIRAEFGLSHITVCGYEKNEQRCNSISILGLTKTWQRQIYWPVIELEIDNEPVRMLLVPVIRSTNYEGGNYASTRYWVDWPASLEKFRAWLQKACEAAAA